jgi:hypothetical protein
MSLTNLVRLIGALAIGWTLVAIGIGASGARLPGPEAADAYVTVSPPVDAMPMHWPSEGGYELVDRTTGRTSPIRLPDEDQWSILCVSPWRGPGGELEAVGRWVNPAGEYFCGWGLFRLSDGAVVSRIATEILPSGRPCWVPGHARTILYPAGDGVLHRCRLAPGEETTGIPGSPVYATGRAEPSEPVVWDVPPPGTDKAFVDDPVWSDEPRLKKWAFVALTPQILCGGRPAYGPTRIWWLEMSDDARRIVAAGRLTPTEGDGIEERRPNVAVGRAGDIHMVYLERSSRQAPWRLRSALLEFDRRTGRPMAAAAEDGPVSGPRGAIQAAPLLVSSDGATVYGLSQSGGLAAMPVAGRCDRAEPGRSRTRSAD